jgi:hypothetical protein
VDAVGGFTNAATRAPQPAMAAPPRDHAPRAAAPPPIAQKEKKGLPVWVWVVGAVVATVAVLGIIGSMMPSDPSTQVAQTPPVQQPVASAPAPANGDNAQAIILSQLQQAQNAAAQQGFQQIGQPFSGSLAQGQSWNVPAELHAGFDYRVLGVCDRDCADLDLVVFDNNGVQVAQDTATSNQPVVAVAPMYSANFTVQVQMFNCTVAPCYYAVVLYGRPMPQ